jgi:hypothetical protein
MLQEAHHGSTVPPPSRFQHALRRADLIPFMYFQRSPNTNPWIYGDHKGHVEDSPVQLRHGLVMCKQCKRHANVTKNDNALQRHSAQKKES